MLLSTLPGCVWCPLPGDAGVQRGTGAARNSLSHLLRKLLAMILNQGDQASPDSGAIISRSSGSVTWRVAATSSGLGSTLTSACANRM